MTATLALTAPLTAVGGVVLAIRQDAGLSWLLGICLPVLLVSVLVGVQ